jgi:DNA-binding CsgD family transcriptional regulator
MTIDEAVGWITRGRTTRRRPSRGWESLTPAELSVVRLVAEGRTNPDIASRLFMSPRTVSTHLSHVFGKLGLSSRTELATEAVRRGL